MSYRDQLVQLVQGVPEEDARLLFSLVKQYLIALEEEKEAEYDAYSRELYDEWNKENYGKVMTVDDAMRLAGQQARRTKRARFLR